MRIGAVRRRVGTRAGAAIAVLLVAAGCSSGDGPQEALDAFADAVNDRDDDAVRELVCESARPDGGGTLADPFAGSPYDIEEIEPRLRNVRWVAEAGDVTEEGYGRATGTVSIEVEGVPDDLPAEAQQALDATLAPFPVGLVGEDDTVTLVEEDGEWRVCDRTSGAASGDGPAPATDALQLRPVLEERTPQVTAAPAAAGPGAGPADLEALAAGGCASLPARTDAAAGEPLVTCSATGDVAYRLGPAETTGEQIEEVSAELQQNGAAGWVIILKASEPGTTAIADLTRRLATQQPPQNELAVVVDGVVVTAPAVPEAITGGELQITGDFDATSARELAARITG
jgi:hypothetical protein